MSVESRAVTVAVVTGGHSFDVPNFHRTFRALEGIDAYIQAVDDFAAAPKETRQAYDVVLLFNMLVATPADADLPWYCGHPFAAFSDLGETPQGIVVLHHALLTYPNWPVFDEIVGLTGREAHAHVGQSVQTLVVDDHPITHGIEPWTMTDEPYLMPEAGAGCRVLLRYDHPLSASSVAWVREYRQSRVFCYEAGHDNECWAHPSFREALRRGILWSAGRL